MGQSGIAFANKPAWNAEREMFGLYFAKVIGVNWQDHTVDVMTEDRAVFQHVPLSSPVAGSDYGEFRMPQFTPVRPTDALEEGNDGTGLPGDTRDSFAVLAFVRGHQARPVVIGFVFPEVSQMMLEGYQKITRHAGDTFHAVSTDGDMWLAFTPDGSHVGFHFNNPSPPVVHGTDYDQRANPATGKKPSFSAILASGASYHMDGETGNIIHVAGQHLHQEAKQQLDLIGQNVVVQGLQALYPAGVAGHVAAPSTDDPSVIVGHLTTNAAYNYRPPVMGIGPNGEGVLSGWTFLTPGYASRVEITPQGKTRNFASTRSGYVGDPIDWDEIPQQAGLTTYKVPPPVPFVLAWSLLGNQGISWTCPELPVGSAAVVFNRNKRANPSGVGTLTLNGSSVPPPDVGNPLVVVEDDVLKYTTTGATTTDENTLTIASIPPLLPDIDAWYSVDPATDPWTVTAP